MEGVPLDSSENHNDDNAEISEDRDNKNKKRRKNLSDIALQNIVDLNDGSKKQEKSEAKDSLNVDSSILAEVFDIKEDFVDDKDEDSESSEDREPDRESSDEFSSEPVHLAEGEEPSDEYSGNDNLTEVDDSVSLEPNNNLLDEPAEQNGLVKVERDDVNDKDDTDEAIDTEEQKNLVSNDYVEAPEVATNEHSGSVDYAVEESSPEEVLFDSNTEVDDTLDKAFLLSDTNQATGGEAMVDEDIDVNPNPNANVLNQTVANTSIEPRPDTVYSALDVPNIVPMQNRANEQNTTNVIEKHNNFWTGVAAGGLYEHFKHKRREKRLAKEAQDKQKDVDDLMVQNEKLAETSKDINRAESPNINMAHIENGAQNSKGLLVDKPSFTKKDATSRVGDIKTDSIRKIENILESSSANINTTDLKNKDLENNLAYLVRKETQDQKKDLYTEGQQSFRDKPETHLENKIDEPSAQDLRVKDKRIEKSEWLSMEVDRSTGKLSSEQSFSYGQAFDQERHEVNKKLDDSYGSHENYDSAHKTHNNEKATDIESINQANSYKAPVASFKIEETERIDDKRLTSTLEITVAVVAVVAVVLALIALLR